MAATQVKRTRTALAASKLPPKILAAARQALKEGKQNKLAVGFLTARAVEMRLGGAAWEAIADELGVVETQAFALVEAQLDRVRRTVNGNLEHLRDIEARRLDMYLVSLMPGCKRGDTQSINTALAVQARRARLLGLDLTPEVAANINIVDNRTIIATPEEVRAALQRNRVLEHQA